MSTRSLIGILESDGSVTSIYSHWDGYVSHHGPILRDHYKTEEKVRALVALGDISSLDNEIGEKHDFNGDHAGVCNAYGRDRGEEGTEARREALREFYSHHSYAYLFDPATLSWTFYKSGKAMPLTLAIEQDSKGDDE